MRRSKADVERYIASVQSSAPTPREKSMKGFFFAKLYYEAKEYELAKRYISSYLNVQERDPKALKFLGHLYEVEGLVDKAVGCYKSSVELNPTQKDLVLKIAELLCEKNVDDGKAEYWVERASKLFPGSPAVYKLKEKLLNFKGEVGWNQLFDLIQSELYTRPDDVYVNIRLVELYRANKGLAEAVNHCLTAEKKGILRSSLEWCACVVHILKEYLKSIQGMGHDKSMWRSLNKELLLAHCNLMLLTLSTRDVHECRNTFQSFDQTLQSVKPYIGGTDDLSITFLEVRGHFYLHAATLLLKMAQHSEAQWRAVTEPAALCYLISFQVPKPKIKSIKDSEKGQVLEMLACDRRSQTGHMLRNLSHNKDDFLKGVVETFANKSGRTVLFEVFFDKQFSMEQTFLGCDDIRDVDSTEPDIADLARCDNGSIRLHNGSLQHLTWLGLQWHMSSPPAIRKWLKQLFPHLPQETTRLDTNAPESICILDLEVFLLAAIFTSNLQLQDYFNIHYNSHQPRCLPLAICTPLCTERQKTWWDAVYNLINKKTQLGSSTKLRLLLQHELITLRALEKHGLQPALIIYWARNLHKTGSSVDSYYDQKDYMVRCVHYWKKVLPLIENIKRKRSIPEPIDPLFKHFHSHDIQVSEVPKFEDEARIAFASLDVVDGKFDDAIQTFYEIKNAVSYWNLARIFRRKAEDIENDAISSEEQEECTNCLQKCKMYLSKIMDESKSDSSVAEKLPVSLEVVKHMLGSVLQQLGEYCGEETSVFKSESSRIDAEIEHLTPSPKKFSISPNKSHKLSPKSPPRWVEDQKALIQMLCHQVEVLKNEVRELKLSCCANASYRWPSEGFGPEPLPDVYKGTPNFHGTPLTVSTSGSSVYYSQSPAYNSKNLLRTAANDASAKGPVYGMNRLPPQQHTYGYPQQTPTPPLQTTSSKFPRDTYGAHLHYDSPASGFPSPRGEEYYNYSVPKNPSNPPLPEPGYFTKPSIAPQCTDLKIEEIGFGQTKHPDANIIPPFIKPPLSTPSSFKFTSSFQTNSSDFAFSTPQFVAPSSTYTGSESLFSLLTSDKPIQDEHSGQKSAEQTNLFSFVVKSTSGTSLVENRAQSQDKTPFVFDKGEQDFVFQNPSATLFKTPNAGEADLSQHSDGGSILGSADDDGPHFEPVVPLPDKVELKTGEEDEEDLFSNRAKLFRFDVEFKEWKERGVGVVKILRHRKSGKVRLLMRREQVLKICANHYINPDMTLKPNAGSLKSYVWHAVDYADELPKPEQLAIRFKTVDEATLFKQKFEQAQKLLTEITSISSPTNRSAEPSHESSGQQNAAKPSPGVANFGLQFAKKLGEWDCKVCSVTNAATSLVCAACQTHPPITCNTVKVAPNAKIDLAATDNVPSPPTFIFHKVAADNPHSGVFGRQLTKKPEEWDCVVCLLRNASTTSVCVACHTACSNLGGEVIAQVAVPNTNVAIPGTFNPAPPFSFNKENKTSAPTAATFSGHSRKKKGPWVCSACSATNESMVKTCTTCKTKITPSSVPLSGQQAISNALPPFDTTASVQGDLKARFSRKEGQWDCSICLVRNESTSANCVSCLTPNPQAQPITTGLPQPTSSVTIGSNMDANNSKPQGFGSHFSKKLGQWDCSACLVRNDPSLTKCAACQTPNPSVKTDPSFPVGSAAFTFGVKNKLSEPTVGKSGTESRKFVSENKSSFGEHLQKTFGQWECTACLVTNEAATKTCIACQTPVAGNVPESSHQAPTRKFGSSNLSAAVTTDLAVLFSRKEDQWDCNVCLVRNKSTSATCVSCLTPNPQALPTVTAVQPTLGPKMDKSTLKPCSGFGAQFLKKGGQWDCSVCLVRNEVTSVKCVSCMTPNPQAKADSALTFQPTSSFKIGSSTETSVLTPRGFGALFSKKEGQWDCSACLVINESSSTKCAACQTPNPSGKTDPSFPVGSAAFTFGLKNKLSEPTFGKSGTESRTVVSENKSSFGEHLQKMFDPWECTACLVTNEAAAKTCIACQTPVAGNVPESSHQAPTRKFGSSNLSAAVTTDLAALFSRKEGQWDCNVCLVRNEVTSVNCVSCMTPNPQAKPDSALTFQPASSCKIGSSTETSVLTPSGFGAQFSKKEGQWDCTACFVRNEPSLSNCAACQTPNSCAIEGSLAAPAASAFKFGSSKLSEPPAVTGLEGGFSGSGFKFGHTEQGNKSSSTFQMPSFNSKSSSGKGGFTFSMPSGGFKIGTMDLSKKNHEGEQTKELTPGFQRVSAKEKPFESVTVASHVGNLRKNDISIAQPISSFSFSDIAKPSNSEFAKKDCNFTSISQTKVKLDTLVVEGAKPYEEQVSSDELYQTEDQDNIHFEPVVQLPDKVELFTGEEEERVLFSERVKLFRFDADTSQWKERGVGSLKILLNESTGALRMLMRRDQVLKVCANHWITSTIKLKPLSGSDRAWMWLANDFSDGDAKLEQLAAKFKTVDLAQDFKYKFEESQKLLSDVPPQTLHNVSEHDSSETVDKEQNYGAGDSLTEEKFKACAEDGKSPDSSIHTSFVTRPSLELSIESEMHMTKNVSDSSSVCNPVKKNMFSFGESAAGFNFSFQPVLSPAKSPTKLNQSSISVGTDEESDITQEEERDGQYFEPVVPLPDLVEVSSGEENEVVLFEHRAKLYRFDKEANQWKERGIGNIKILQNYNTKSVRIIMRRDQVLKLCANHRITPDINLKPMTGTERAWVWTAHDFAEGEGDVEMFAVRFKLQDVADLFHSIFDEAKYAQERGTLLTPLPSRGSTPNVTPCGKMAVAVLEEATRERTDQSHEYITPVVSPVRSEASKSSETPTKAVVSPPKFTFGSDSVKNIFSSDKPKSFTFGSTSTRGSLFGFSFNPLLSDSKKNTSVTQNATAKKLDFDTGVEFNEVSSINQTKEDTTPSMSSKMMGSSAEEKHQILVKDENRKEAESQSFSEDVVFVYELAPTLDQKAFAESLCLPTTFFCYKNMPGYKSEDDEDDEDFESAVKKLNGKLYLDNSVDFNNSEDKRRGVNWQVEVSKEVKFENMKSLPTSFAVEVSEDLSQEAIHTFPPIKSSQNGKVASSTNTAKTIQFGAASSTSTLKDEYNYTTESTLIVPNAPVDLSTNKQMHNPASTMKGLENFDLFGLGSSTGQSFADLASGNSGDFAFGSTDKNFAWQNAGSAVFSSLASAKRGDHEGDCGDEVEQNDDIHFEPIVSLPEVEVKSGEEDEQILFKERAKMYRWDRTAAQWKERGVGEIKILFHPEKKSYRVLMRRDKIHKVCANHSITKSMDIQPLTTSNNALVWTAMDYADDQATLEQLAVRFQTPELANSFKMKFQECQQKLPDETKDA